MKMINQNNALDRGRQPSNRHTSGMEPLEDRRLMAAIDQASRALAGYVHISSPSAHQEMPLHVAGASDAPAAPNAPKPLSAPTGSAAVALQFSPVPDAEFPSNGIGADVVTGTYTPRIKLWGAQRIGDAGASIAHPAARLSDAVGSRPPVVRKTHPTPAPRRALLVEPDPIARMALATLLRMRGWSVTAVPDCTAAEEHLAERPDVVIIDIDRAETHGEALLRHIRSAGLNARVAVITDDALDPRVPRLARLHPDAMLSKPLNVATLLRSLSPTQEPDVPQAWN